MFVCVCLFVLLLEEIYIICVWGLFVYYYWVDSNSDSNNNNNNINSNIFCCCCCCLDCLDHCQKILLHVTFFLLTKQKKETKQNKTKQKKGDKNMDNNRISKS